MTPSINLTPVTKPLHNHHKLFSHRELKHTHGGFNLINTWFKIQLLGIKTLKETWKSASNIFSFQQYFIWIQVQFKGQKDTWKKAKYKEKLSVSRFSNSNSRNRLQIQPVMKLNQELDFQASNPRKTKLEPHPNTQITPHITSTKMNFEY